MFTSSPEFQRQHLNDPRTFARWLGAWQPRKATFVLELAAVTTVVAPNWTGPLVLSGRRYVAERPNRRGASPAEDAFERLWHRTAIGLLQRIGRPSDEEEYLDTLRTRRRAPANAAPDDDRWLLAYAIAAEQRCWNDRPDLLRAGEHAANVTRASGAPATSGVSRSAIATERARQRACLSDAAGRFDAAAATEDAGAEARVRGAWMRFQLGQFREALHTIDGVAPGDDRELAYWASLFRGRIHDALGRQPDAERAYRAALDAWPDAQSAGVGLALTLFRMHRPAEADAVALAVRSRSAAVSDPWWTYPGADQRFVGRWLALLRAARP
jgi:tetratricopeptide (TPR) repeat protein